MSTNYETVIGLEVHIQLNTQSKMFCGCSNKGEDAPPNTTICPVCFGMPGTLPVANKEAIRKTLLLGVALGAKLAEVWNFERKNYFYPDLPKGYQITSSSNPPVIGGAVEVKNPDQTDGYARLGIHHIHLEEDAGKLLHGDKGYSYVDLNRAGTPLIELVSLPEKASAQQARAFLVELQILARRLGISEADMEKGHLRCDANISVHKAGEPLGKKVEIKNLNSFRMVEKALEYEVKRQTDALERGKEIIQETRGWDDQKNMTVSHRNKAEVHDYRYLPEPDIPPIVTTEVKEFGLDEIKSTMPELPSEARKRMQEQYGLTPPQAEICIADPAFGQYVESVFKALPAVKGIDYQGMATRVLFGDVRRIATEQSIKFEETTFTDQEMLQTIEMLVLGKLSHQLFKSHLARLLKGEELFADFSGLASEGDAINLDEVIGAVLTEEAKAVSQWKAGDQKVLGFLVGRIMAKTEGKADPRQVNQKLRDSLTDG